MNVTKVEAGTIVVVLLAILAGAVQFGRLQGRIEDLDSKVIRGKLDDALHQIDEARTLAVGEIGDLARGQQRAQWIDVKDDRTRACVDTSSGRQHCLATNDLPYPITVAIETVNQHRTKKQPSRGCGAAIHLVVDEPDWHTPVAEGNAADFSLAQMVTGDEYGVCWVSATIPSGSSYYVVNAYRPHVLIVNWFELR